MPKTKIEVWCQSRRSHNQEIRAVRAWVGEVNRVPSIGEDIEVYDGWCSEQVLLVTTCLDTDRVYIKICPDISGAYLEEAIIRGYEEKENAEE